MVHSSSGSAARKWLPLMLMLTTFAMVESFSAVKAQQKNLDSEGQFSADLRGQLEDIIRKSPGTYFRSAIRETNRTVGVIQYHLHHLEQEGKIFAFGINNYKGYFPTALRTLTDDKKAALIMLRVPQKQDIMNYLAVNGKVLQKDLTEQFQLSNQNLSYHLKVLEQMGILERCRTGMGKAVVLDPEIHAFIMQWIE